MTKLGPDRSYARRRRGAILVVVCVFLSLVFSLQAVTPPSRANADDQASCITVPSTAADSQPVVGSTALGDSGSFIADFITSIISNAAGDAATSGAGFLLSLILGNGGNGGANEQELLNNQAAQQAQLNAIQTSINDLANQLTDAQFSIKSQLTQSTYDELVSNDNSNISNIQKDVQAVCNLAANASSYNVNKPYPPDSEDIGTINDLRTNGLTYLDNMSNALTGGGTGAEGIITVFRQAYWNSVTSDPSSPPSKATWTSGYLAAMHSLLDYYVNLAGQLLNAYAEAAHWQNAAAPGVPELAPLNSDKVQEFYNQLQPDILAWSQAATNDLPTIPSGTAIDIRSNPDIATTVDGTYNLWATSPITLAGSNANQYCATPAQACVYNEWFDNGIEDQALTTSLVPSIDPISSYLVTNPLGLTGWHVPTVDDWQNWITPSYIDGSLSGIDPSVAGVGPWATSENIPILTPTAVSVSSGTVSVIPPVVVSDPVDQVLTFNAPASNAPKAPLAAAGSGVGYAGQLALETNIQAGPLAIPATSNSSSRSDSSTSSTGATAGRSAAVAPILTGSAHPHPAVASTTASAAVSQTGTLGQATTFSSGSSCVSNGFTQPAGANAVQVTVTGGNGGAGLTGDAFSSQAYSSGGEGGQVTATIPLAAGVSLYAQVGGKGGDSFYSGNNGGGEGTFNPGTAGSGNGAPGGSVIQPMDNDIKPGAGGGGGGFSGLSIASDCSQWVVVAGGGGGGGGGDVHNTGSNGGNACVTSGCAGQSPTETNGDSGAGAGGDRNLPGGAGTHFGNSAGNGGGSQLISGMPLALGGGTGGVGGNGSEDPSHDWAGGSGGGGGGGWGGGGGGGGSTGDYAGAGGGGGGSYVAAGLSTSNFSLSSSGASVTITPVDVPEYVVGSDVNGNIGSSSTVLDNPGGTSTDGTVLNRAALVSGSSEQQWALLPTGQLSAGNPYYQLLNPATGKCAAGSSTLNDNVTLSTCTSDPSQWWAFYPTSTGTYMLYSDYTVSFFGSTVPLQAVASTGFPGYAVPVTMFPGLSANDAQWALQLDTPSVWSVQAPGLTDVPPGQQPPGGPSTPPDAGVHGSSAGTAQSGQLAATGLSVGLAGAAAVALLLAGLFIMVGVSRRRRESSGR